MNLSKVVQTSEPNANSNQATNASSSSVLSNSQDGVLDSQRAFGGIQTGVTDTRKGGPTGTKLTNRDMLNEFGKQLYDIINDSSVNCTAREEGKRKNADKFLLTERADVFKSEISMHILEGNPISLKSLNALTGTNDEKKDEKKVSNDGKIDHVKLLDDYLEHDEHLNGLFITGNRLSDAFKDHANTFDKNDPKKQDFIAIADALTKIYPEHILPERRRLFDIAAEQGMKTGVDVVEIKQQVGKHHKLSDIDSIKDEKKKAELQQKRTEFIQKSQDTELFAVSLFNLILINYLAINLNGIE